MALVDYSSGSDASADDDSHTADVQVTKHVTSKRKPAGNPSQPSEERNLKKQRPHLVTPDSRSGSQGGSGATPGSASASLPPLPAGFHDLYASTVRASTVDNPSLHQGRSRQIPHVAGNWPSHIYIEWFPQSAESQVLHSLLQSLQLELGGTDVKLHTFLTSDLGAPLPLHVSLSRPFVLKTQEKDKFLEELEESIQAAHVKPLHLYIHSLAWHRSPDSNRSFLVLRIKPLKEMSTLLTRCNKLVAAYGQPRLYASAEGPGGEAAEERDAFHISIAWSFSDPKLVERQTTAVFARSELRDSVTSIKVGVGSVKAKIGNVITSIGFEMTRSGSKRGAPTSSLFGV